MIDVILEKENRRREALKVSTALLTNLLTISIEGIEEIIIIFGTLFGAVNKQESFYERYINRMIDKSLTKFAVNDMKAQIKTISNGVCQIKNCDLPDDDRKLKVEILFYSCDKILNNFEEHENIFYQHHLITTPFLIAFSRLYFSIIEVGAIHMPYKDYNYEKQRLKNIIEEYKTNTINDRIKMIKIKETYKRIGPDLHMIKNAATTYLKDTSRGISEPIKQIAKNDLIRDVDVVQDALWNEENPKEMHNWDRAVWDQQQGTKYNYKYTDVVRIVYENFFDDVISYIK